MRFEHLVEINDPGDPRLTPLTPEQLWQGLVLRAMEPELFMLGLDRSEIVARGDSWMDRELHFGGATVQDRVVLEPRRGVRYERGHGRARRGTLSMMIEAPAEGALLLRFLYETTMPTVDETGNDRYAEIVKSAYHEADLDTVRKIRELAASGRLR